MAESFCSLSGNVMDEQVAISRTRRIFSGVPLVVSVFEQSCQIKSSVFHQSCRIKSDGNPALEERFKPSEGELTFCCRDPQYNIWKRR